MKLSRELVVFDLETTGTWIEKDRIVEIGMIKLMPDGSKQEYIKRVNPGIPIPANVTRIIGIECRSTSLWFTTSQQRFACVRLPRSIPARGIIPTL